MRQRKNEMSKKKLDKLDMNLFKDCNLVYGVEKKEDGFHFHRALDGVFCPKEIITIGAIMANELVNFCLEDYADRKSADFKDLRELEKILEVMFYKEFTERRENDSFF